MDREPCPLILLCVETPHSKFNAGGMGFCFLCSIFRLRWRCLE